MAQSAVAFLLTKLGSLIEAELKSLGRVKGEIVFIRDELQSMSAFLRVADAIEDTDLEIQAWVEQVRDVAHDTDDVLDEFMLRFAHRHHHHHHHRGFYGSVCKIYYQIQNLKARRQIASDIQDIKARVIDIAERRQRYGYKFSTSEQASSSDVANNGGCYDRRGDALLFEEDDLVGIDNPKQQLIDGVLDDADSRLKVISVVGMGGLGKTTLIKKVYDDLEVKRQFQTHATITVSQSFNIKEILTGLIQQLFDEVRRPLPHRFETMDNSNLKAVLKEFLQESKYVLVLDDIWSLEAWDDIKIALPNSNCGSRVLLTTRIVNVASTSCRESHGYIYEMKALSQEESWTLFCNKTFQGKDCPPHLIELSESILRRCEGLPLAIVVISGLLVSKDQGSVDEWELVNRCLGAEVEVSYLKKILLLSYSDLPYYLKSCLLYLSCFPEDHLIDWMSTIRLWIAEGFVEVKELGKTLEEVAEAYLYELLNRSLIQVATRRLDRRIKNCRIHDLLREIILSKSRDHNFLTIAGEGEGNMRCPEKARRLSIHNTLPDIPEQGKCFSRLRSLLMFGVDEPMSKSSMPLLFNGGLRLLKVLHLSSASLERFPGHVVKLFHLKYLSLRGTNVKVLPKSIGLLWNLETLDLKNTYVRELPIEVLRLQKLRHLLLYHDETGHIYFPFHFRHGFEAPSKIGGLQSLQKLCFLEANHANGSTLMKEIGRLTQLRRLGILKLRREDGVGLCLSIEKLSNLRSLGVTSIEDDEILDLQSLSAAPQFLQRLYLTGRLEKLPQWITSLHGLTRLSLWWSKLRDDPLKSLQDFPNLVRLSLAYEAYEGEGLCFKAGRFQRLKRLSLIRLKGLRWLTMEEGTMSRLEDLYFWNCELLEELPSGIEHLSNLKYLELSDMSNELISKLNPGVQDGDYWKIEHIPKVWIDDSKDGRWKGRFL
ncbi:disease resistance protein RPM1-like [Camellia sinensis]|uniref:disease resistance protein RPM1-like n=1 Tax=Camellia sinensis TaxID=4442 RepID=UPI001036C5AA|nr:disease resistance protein RPM1-like [Camellia sinensis]